MQLNLFRMQTLAKRWRKPYLLTLKIWASTITIRSRNITVKIWHLSNV